MSVSLMSLSTVSAACAQPTAVSETVVACKQYSDARARIRLGGHRDPTSDALRADGMVLCWKRKACDPCRSTHSKHAASIFKKVRGF